MTEPVLPEGSANEHAEANAWLEGLAGRAGEGPAHHEGQRLRAALQPDAAQVAPPWAEIERRAFGASTGEAPVPAHVGPRHGDAANGPRWGSRWAMAASVAALAVAAAAWIWPRDDESAGWRGLGAAATGPVWRVGDPSGAARSLALELQALGAQVTVQPDGPAVRLTIEAPSDRQAAVNQRLQPLETALDAQGRLTLQVMAP